MQGRLWECTIFIDAERTAAPRLLAVPIASARVQLVCLQKSAPSEMSGRVSNGLQLIPHLQKMSNIGFSCIFKGAKNDSKATSFTQCKVPPECSFLKIGVAHGRPNFSFWIVYWNFSDPVLVLFGKPLTMYGGCAWCELTLACRPAPVDRKSKVYPKAKAAST